MNREQLEDFKRRTSSTSLIQYDPTTTRPKLGGFVALAVFFAMVIVILLLL